jgi:drug/metabolite transporter (DMT)-like permease
MNDQSKGLLITALGVLAIIPDTSILRLVDEPAMTMAFWRAFLSGIAIFAYLLITGQFKALFRLRGAGLAFASCFAINTVLFVTAVTMTSVAATVFILATAPVWAMIISRVFLSEQLTPRMVITVLLALCGVGIIALGASGNSTAMLGNLAALGVAILLATAFTIARASRHVSMIPATGLSYFLAALIVLPFVQTFHLEPADWPKMLSLGFLCLPFGTCMMAIGPRYITSAEVGLLLLLESVFAPILVWYLIGEDPGTHALIGGALVLLVLAVSNIIGLRTANKRRAA